MRWLLGVLRSRWLLPGLIALAFAGVLLAFGAVAVERAVYRQSASGAPMKTQCERCGREGFTMFNGQWYCLEHCPQEELY